jgi:hypothetical protein
MKFLKIVGIILAAIVIIIASIYLYIRFMPEKNIAKQEASYTINAAVLAEEYNRNPDVSDKKYIDRIIQVTGTISEITTDQNKSKVIILRENNSSSGVLCTLSDNSSKNAQKYHVGNTITIKGTCTGMLFEVVLNKCVIVR